MLLRIILSFFLVISATQLAVSADYPDPANPVSIAGDYSNRTVITNPNPMQDEQMAEANENQNDIIEVLNQ